MSEDNVIRFPVERRQSDEPIIAVQASEAVILECNEIVHHFQSVPGYCQCGERFWESLDKPPA